MKRLRTYHSARSGSVLPGQPGRLRWLLLCLLLLPTLACGLGQPTGHGVAMLTRLPTLTRTPLPTLTPTLPAEPTARAMALQATSAAVEPAAAPPQPAGQPAPVQGETGPALARVSSPASVAAQPASPNPAAVMPAATGAAAPNVTAAGGINPAQGIALTATPTRAQHVAAPLPTPMPTNNLQLIAPPRLVAFRPGTAPTPTATRRPAVTFTPSATSAPLPTRISTAAPTVAAQPTSPVDVATGGWSFASTRVAAETGNDGLLLFGELINDTGSTQELHYVSGTFFDDGGQIIADRHSTADYAPVYDVPAGGRVPFELTVSSIRDAASFKLWARSEASDRAVRQDFEFSEVTEQANEDSTCLSGAIFNPGDGLDDHLNIVAILYDDQSGVINFAESYQTGVAEFAGDIPLDFEICVETAGPVVARVELRAWGQ